MASQARKYRRNLETFMNKRYNVEQREAITTGNFDFFDDEEEKQMAVEIFMVLNNKQQPYKKSLSDEL